MSGLEILMLTGILTGGLTTLLGGAINIIGTVRNQRQQTANLEAQRKVNEQNARKARIEGARVNAETKENVLRQQETNKRDRARQAALFGKSGVAITSGSPLAVLGETAGNQQIGLIDKLRAGRVESNKQEQNAQNFLYQARVAEAEKTNVRKQMQLSVLGEGIKMIGDVGNTLTSIGKGFK